MNGNVIHKFANDQLPLKPPRVFLKKPVIQHQKRRVVLPICACQNREKIVGQNGKNAGSHCFTLCQEVAFVNGLTSRFTISVGSYPYGTLGKISDYDFYVVLQDGARIDMHSSSGINVTPHQLLQVYEPEILRYLYAKYPVGDAFDFGFDDTIIRHYMEFDRGMDRYLVGDMELATIDFSTAIDVWEYKLSKDINAFGENRCLWCLEGHFRIKVKGAVLSNSALYNTILAVFIYTP